MAILIYGVLSLFLISAFGEFLVALAICTVMLPVSVATYLSYIWTCLKNPVYKQKKTYHVKDEVPNFASYSDGMVNMNEIDIK